MAQWMNLQWIEKIYKSNVIVHNLWKIWRPAPVAELGLTAGRQLGRRNLDEV